MNKKHNNQTPPEGSLPRLKGWQAALLHLLLAIVISGVILVMALKIQPNQFSYMVEQFEAQPLLLVMNLLPVFMVLMILSSLMGNLFYGAAVTELIVGGLSLANRIKCGIRGEPVYPRDLKMLREVGQAMSAYHISLPKKILAAILLFAIVMIAVGVILPRLTKRPAGLRGWSRWIHLAANVAVWLLLVFVVYHSRPLYTSFSGGHFFHPQGAYNDLGFPYSFCHYLTTNSIDKPSGFDEAEAAAWDNEDLGDPESLPVNVVIVMNESFTDFVGNDVFTYSPKEDPIGFYHSMIAREDVLSGHLVVMNLGGGTANTEFDVMTGIRSDSISKGTPITYRTIDHNIDSIFRLYKSVGYRTSYIHLGNRWFYNRNHVMPWLGVDKTLFMEDMEDPEILGDYVSDAYTSDTLIGFFEEETAGGDLVFNYTTTIQNHMNYTPEKYGEDHPIPPVQCSAELDEETATALGVYIEGLRYADAGLETLVDYFETCGKPVLFVFYGDHFPYMGANNYGYLLLGMEDENFNLYEPPFFIWANDEAQEILDWDNLKESLDMPELLAASYLGAVITEITGISESSPWYTYLNALRREYPVVWHQAYMNTEGEVLYELSPEDTAKMEKWHRWSYYRMTRKTVAD